nr:SGNH/GDSL hydrolase family protein [Allomuricauda sp.]
MQLCQAQNDSIAYLALGDSYTHGTGELIDNSWPYQMVQRLHKNQVPIKYPVVIAQPGWTTSDLLEAIESQNPKPEYDLVSLQIGVNNQYQRLPIALFKKEFSDLLQQSINFAKGNPGNVLILSIPDWSATPFARYQDKARIVKELNTYNKIIVEMAKAKGISVVDVTKISRNASVNPDWVVADSLHPSKKMYKAWVKKIGKTLKLQKP